MSFPEAAYEGLILVSNYLQLRGKATYHYSIPDCRGRGGSWFELTDSYEMKVMLAYYVS